MGPVRTKHREALGGPYLWLSERYFERADFTALVNTKDGARFYFDGVSTERARDDEPLVVEPLDTVDVRLFHNGIGLDAGTHELFVAPDRAHVISTLETAIVFERVGTGQARLVSATIAVPRGWRVRLGSDGPTWLVPDDAASGAILLPEHE